jgi:hypothetical protein
MEQFKVFITRSARKIVQKKKGRDSHTPLSPLLPFFSPYTLSVGGIYNWENFYYFLFFFSNTKVVDVGRPFFLHTVFVPTGALSNIKRTNWGGRWWSNKLLLFSSPSIFPPPFFLSVAPAYKTSPKPKILCVDPSRQKKKKKVDRQRV